MGQLVFQATLGGAVNLIGPNIAGTVNFTLPSADGTSGQALSTNGTGTLAFSSFATLVSNTFTGSQTLSAGTANGVTYLNGSKVLTSGSALTFDGTNFASTGNITSGGTLQALSTVQSSSGADLSLNANGANRDVIFKVNATELARLVGSTGNFGIGTSSPSSKLDVSGSGVIATLTGTGVTSYLKMTNTGQTSANGFQVQTVNEDVYVVNYSTAGNIFFSTNGSSNNDMTIDSAGNLLVGTNAGNYRLNIKGAGSAGDSSVYAQFTTADTGTTGSDGLIIGVGVGSSPIAYINNLENSALAFATNGSERARITSGGDFYVAKTAGDASTVGCELRANGAAYVTRSTSTNDTETLGVYSTGASAYRFYVGMAGTVFATSTTISAISDIRYKENVRDLDVGLNAVMALKPRLYDWKEGKGADIKNARGFIAQEFEEVFPDLIDTWKDPAPEGEEPYKSVRQDLIPVLVKAIQEQQALIQSLKARLDAANL